MGCQGILLDIDNTLYDYESAHKLALDHTLKHLSKCLDSERHTLEEAYRKAKEEVHAALAETASSHNKLLYFQKMCEILSIPALKQALDFYNLYWDKFVENIHAYEHVYDFLNSVRGKKVCLLSDLTAYTQYIKINRLGLYDYADYIVTSEEVGREKPDPGMFLRGLQKLGMGPKDACMIGDNYERDIRGAINLGIRCFYLDIKGEAARKQAEPLVTVVKNFKQLREHFYDRT